MQIKKKDPCEPRLHVDNRLIPHFKSKPYRNTSDYWGVFSSSAD